MTDLDLSHRDESNRREPARQLLDFIKVNLREQPFSHEYPDAKADGETRNHSVGIIYGGEAGEKEISNWSEAAAAKIKIHPEKTYNQAFANAARKSWGLRYKSEDSSDSSEGRGYQGTHVPEQTIAELQAVTDSVKKQIAPSTRQEIDKYLTDLSADIHKVGLADHLQIAGGEGYAYNTFHHHHVALHSLELIDSSGAPGHQHLTVDLYGKISDESGLLYSKTRTADGKTDLVSAGSFSVPASDGSKAVYSSGQILIALQTPGKTGIAEIETDNGHSPTQIKFEDGSLIRGFGSGGTFETADHKTYPIDAFRFNIDEVGYMIKDREVHRTFDGSFDVYNRKDHEHFYRQPGQTKWLKEAPELTGLASMFYAKPKDLSVSQDVEEMLNGLIGK